VDLASHHRAYPPAAGPAHGRRPAPAMGEAARTRATHSGAGAAWISQHPHEDPLIRRCTETLPTRSWTTARLEEPETRPTSRHRTRPRDRCGIPAPHAPQEGHQTPPNRLTTR
jgi:hypothetical protein